MDTFIPIRLFVLICLAGLFAYTVLLIRSGRLSAHLAISWILTEALLIAAVLIGDIPAALRSMVGESDYFTAVFVLVVGWIVLLMLDTLTRVSEVEGKARIAVQENSLLQRRIEVLEASVAELTGEASDGGRHAQDGRRRSGGA